MPTFDLRDQSGGLHPLAPFKVLAVMCQPTDRKMRERLLDLESQRKALKEVLTKPAPTPYPSLHPNLIQLYKCKAAALEEALNDPGVRSEASEILRSLIDRIEITPAPDGTGYPGGDDPGPDTESSTASLGIVIVLYGQLAAVFCLAEENGAIENKRRFSLSAGAHNQLKLNPVFLIMNAWVSQRSWIHWAAQT